MLTASVLSLSDLAGFDPRAGGLIIGQGGGEHRFLCPLCGVEKPRDAAHRCLCLNAGSGVWRCHRCAASGKLRDGHSSGGDERHRLPRSVRSRVALAQTFAASAASSGGASSGVPLSASVGSLTQHSNSGISEAVRGASPAPSAPTVSSNPWKRALRDLRPLGDTPGAAYLSGRGLDAEEAGRAGARFCADFFGASAVVFPLRDHNGGLVGAQGRYLESSAVLSSTPRQRKEPKAKGPKARTIGDKRSGLFATPGAFDAALPALIITEAPLDALSLALAGYPAVAVCGTEPPVWIHRVSAFRSVLLAFDADEAGDRAADKLAPHLTSFGARPERLRPEAAKDWNEMLIEQGRDALADWLALQVLTM